MNIHAGRGVAVREFRLASGHGFADYVLYADQQAIGVIEAKKEGCTLTGVEVQAEKYSVGMPADLPAPVRPLPFLYQSTGVETRFTNPLVRGHALIAQRHDQVRVLSVDRFEAEQFDCERFDGAPIGGLRDERLRSRSARPERLAEAAEKPPGLRPVTPAAASAHPAISAHAGGLFDAGEQAEDPPARASLGLVHLRPTRAAAQSLVARRRGGAGRIPRWLDRHDSDRASGPKRCQRVAGFVMGRELTLALGAAVVDGRLRDRKSTRLNSSHPSRSRMPSSA
jgi:hypothetical protein